MNGFSCRRDRVHRLFGGILGIGVMIALSVIANRAGAGKPGYIDTYAGGGPKAGETGPFIGNINDMTIDSSGNIYISTNNDNVVWKLEPNGELTIIAGNRRAGFTGDGGLATFASLKYPAGMAINSDGDVFIADVVNSRIRKVDHLTGIITTVAGTGAFGYSGDEIQATSAELAGPYGVAVNSDGDLFIADSGNFRIRKVDHLTGYISTYAGNGKQGYSGDGGPAISAELYSPVDVKFDLNSDLFIVDGNKIRKIDTRTGIISTYAGTISSKYPPDYGDGELATAVWIAPWGIAFNSSDDLFIADNNKSTIRKIDHQTGIISTVAGNGSPGYSGDGGLATSAQFYWLVDVAINSNNDLLIADANLDSIRIVDHATGIISSQPLISAYGTVGDGGLATSAFFTNPEGMAIDKNGDLIIADMSDQRIRKVDHITGIISTIAGTGKENYSGDGGAAISATFHLPSDVAFNSKGDLFIADTNNNRIRKIDHATAIISTVAGTGAAGYSGDGIPAIAATLNKPYGIAIDADDNLFIADHNNYREREVDHATGIIKTYAGTGKAGFTGDGGFASSASIDSPLDVSLNSSGDLFIVVGNRIREVAHATGIITTVAGNGMAGYSGDGGLAVDAQLNAPFSVEVNLNGDLFIADTDNQLIRKVDQSSGIIKTVAGNETNGINSDNIQAVNAKINRPNRLIFNSNGDMFFSERFSGKIRVVYQPGADAESPSVSVGYGASYVSADGSGLGSGHLYARIVMRDGDSGYGAFSLSGASNVLMTVAREKIGDSAFVSGVSQGTTNPVYVYLVRSDPTQPMPFSFSVSDAMGNVNAPKLNPIALNFAAQDQTLSADFPSVAKDQGQVSILASSGALRSVSVTANGETIAVGDVPAGTAKTIDPRSRLKDGSDNAVSVTATGDAGAEASVLVSSATLDRIDEAAESARKVYRRGDANADGRIDIRDATLLLRFVAGLSAPTDAERALGDVNLDGKLTVGDATATLRLAIGG